MIPRSDKASTDIVCPHCQFYHWTGLVFLDNGCLCCYLTGLSFVKLCMCFCQIAQAKLWLGHLFLDLCSRKRRHSPDNGCLCCYLTGVSFVKRWMCFWQIAQAKLWHGHLFSRLVLEKKQTLPMKKHLTNFGQSNSFPQLLDLLLVGRK
jgi:hypothetical protein